MARDNRPVARHIHAHRHGRAHSRLFAEPNARTNPNRDDRPTNGESNRNPISTADAHHSTNSDTRANQYRAPHANASAHVRARPNRHARTRSGAHTATP